MVNMGGFSLPGDLPGHQLWPNMVDRTVEKLILFFAQEKFKTLFSLLFGLGLAVQMMRAEARGADEWVTQLLRQGDAKVFKKYSQLKLQMKREALQKLNRAANESAGVLGQAG